MSAPAVSVVMSVYNGAETLAGTLRSVLEQEGCDFELIAVDDGSTDGSGDILDQWAAGDERLRVIHQENRGLTRALIRGCAEARGEFIARHDAGDQSLPGRISQQAAVLASTTRYVAATCHTLIAGPRNEILYSSEIDQDTLNESLRAIDPSRLAGPSHHGSVMMRRELYHVVGGYRPQFYFAQDLDLWTRLAEHGEFAVIPRVLYRARLQPRSISAIQAPEQRLLKGLIAKAAAARRSGSDEAPWLDQAAEVRKISSDGVARRLAAGSFFIGSCLRAADPHAARSYFRKAVGQDPMHWRAWARFVECTIRTRIRAGVVINRSARDR